MTKKKTLEDSISEKVRPFIQENIEKTWGLAIPKLEEDITDKLAKDQVAIPIMFHLPFHESLKMFKKEFFKRELSKHHNISLLAKLLGVNRRSIHRTIKELGIEILDNQKEHDENYFKEQEIYKSLRDALHVYSGLFKDERMAELYNSLPNLSKTLALEMPKIPAMTWNGAKKDFETRYLKHHISLGDKLKDVAKRIGLEPESLSRKLKQLRLK